MTFATYFTDQSVAADAYSMTVTNAGTQSTVAVKLDALGSIYNSANGIGVFINPDVPGGLVSSEADGLAFDPSFLQYTSVEMAYTDIQGMYAAPFELIPARAGYFYVIDSVMIAMNAADFVTEFANGGDIYLQYTATAAATNSACSQSILASQLIALQDNSVLTIPGGFPVNTVAANSTFWLPNINTPVCITNATGAFTGGDEAILTVHLWFRAINSVA